MGIERGYGADAAAIVDLAGSSAFVDRNRSMLPGAGAADGDARRVLRWARDDAGRLRWQAVDSGDRWYRMRLRRPGAHLGAAGRSATVRQRNLRSGHLWSVNRRAGGALETENTGALQNAGLEDLFRPGQAINRRHRSRWNGPL